MENMDTTTPIEIDAAADATTSLSKLQIKNLKGLNLEIKFMTNYLKQHGKRNNKIDPQILTSINELKKELDAFVEADKTVIDVEADFEIAEEAFRLRRVFTCAICNVANVNPLGKAFNDHVNGSVHIANFKQFQAKKEENLLKRQAAVLAKENASKDGTVAAPAANADQIPKNLKQLENIIQSKLKNLVGPAIKAAAAKGKGAGQTGVVRGKGPHPAGKGKPNVPVNQLKRLQNNGPASSTPLRKQNIRPNAQGNRQVGGKVNQGNNNRVNNVNGPRYNNNNPRNAGAGNIGYNSNQGSYNNNTGRPANNYQNDRQMQRFDNNGGGYGGVGNNYQMDNQNYGNDRQLAQEDLTRIVSNLVSSRLNNDVGLGGGGYRNNNQQMGGSGGYAPTRAVTANIGSRRDGMGVSDNRMGGGAGYNNIGSRDSDFFARRGNIF